MSENCKSCVYINKGKCTNEYFKGIARKDYLIIVDSENDRCELYESSKCC